MADDTIRYLNTDLDLKSTDELTALGAAFEKGGVFPLYLVRGEDRLWYATFEVLGQEPDPEASIRPMLSVIESLEPTLRSLWTGCTLREFNIGYDCGRKPWSFNQGLSTELLRRIAAIGASLRITIYPMAKMSKSASNQGKKIEKRKRKK